jgi:hypothetical protein
MTQQFNTTTSMGRLTLNVLLSFAQFEREVTSERIRDKIAASKRKGLWVGGNLPLGYEMKDGKIAVVDKKAELVRSIFRRRRFERDRQGLSRIAKCSYLPVEFALVDLQPALGGPSDVSTVESPTRRSDTVSTALASENLGVATKIGRHPIRMGTRDAAGLPVRSQATPDTNETNIANP